MMSRVGSLKKTPNRTRTQSYNFPFSSLSGRLSSLLTILLLFSYLKMMRTGMGYRFSHTNRRISTAGASNIVTRLASRTVRGNELPIHVHQHYALEFHLVLNPNTKSCIRRRFLNARHARQLCYLLIGSAMSGLCSCLFDSRGKLTDDLEQCFRVEPIEITSCDCDLCTPHPLLQRN